MKELSRRKFLQISALAVGSTMVPMPLKWLGTSKAEAFAQSLPLSESGVSPFRGLAFSGPVLGVIPPSVFYANDPNGIPVLSGTPDPHLANTTLYNITVEEYQDQLYPAPAMGPTTLLGYRDSNAPVKSGKHLGGLIVAARGTASRLRFTNNLPSTHIIPMDKTVPGSNQRSDRTATHIHGGFVPWTSDGGPFDWFSPAADSSVRGNGASGLSFQNGKGGFLDAVTGSQMVAGQADYYYPNEQSTRLMWYHDHAWGITRINAYAGIATGYLCLDLTEEAPFAHSAVLNIVTGNPNPFKTLDGNGPKFGQMPQLTNLIPLVWQDKIFVNAKTAAVDPTWKTAAPGRVQGDGSLWYAHTYDPNRWRIKRGRGYLTPPDPSIIAEFFGDTMLCNGTVAPVVPVTPTSFRFLLLNACNARFLNINMLKVNPGCEVVTDPLTGLPASQYNYVSGKADPTPPAPGLPMIQIAAEGGYLPKAVVFPATAPTAATGNIVPFNPVTFSGNLILGCAERADLIIDFSTCAFGDEFVFYNDSAGPYPGGDPRNDYYAGNPNTPAAVLGSTIDTRNILRFKVVDPATIANPPIFAYPQVPAASIQLPPMDPPPIASLPLIAGDPLVVPAGTFVRDLTLNEDFDPYGRLRQLIGTTKKGLIGGGFGMEYLAPATEVIAQGTTEVWRIFNTTADTHPMHFHLQTGQIISRQPFALVSGIFTPTGVARGPEPNEMGWKETAKCNPGEVISIVFKWDQVPVPFSVPYSDRPMGSVGSIIANGNEFVWHCHILEHEEHDMMRPLVITGKNPQRPNILPTSGPVGQMFSVILAATATGFTVTGPAVGAVDNVNNTFVANAAGSYVVTDNTGLSSSVTVK
ncbi:MAG: multicopper oxidase domain-containing protein [Desulfuromonadaceae bacterium]|nr:multicopper oxidase domain-containing protein [Desulfuromonadaceae bacterium]